MPTSVALFEFQEQFMLFFLIIRIRFLKNIWILRIILANLLFTVRSDTIAVHLDYQLYNICKLRKKAERFLKKKNNQSYFLIMSAKKSVKNTI